MADPDGRRANDNTRLDRLESSLIKLQGSYQELEKSDIRMETRIEAVQTEQAHMRELFEARFKVQEKVLEDQTGTLRMILDTVTRLSSDPDGSPVSKAWQTAITTMTTELTELREWRNQVAGGWILVRWVGYAGVAMLIMAAMRTIFVLLKSSGAIP